MADRNSPEWLARFTAPPKLARKLHKLGGKRLAPPETFFVKDRQGPLYEGEIERAQGWAHLLRKRLQVKRGKDAPTLAPEVSGKAL
jgi:hypothetical protein